jgi:hypothetical protein
MRVEELRDRLLKLLANELGTYTIVGKSTPAIAILSTGESLPNDRRVEGLEIIIRREPQSEYKAMYGGGYRVKTWQLFASQWDGEYTLHEALFLICAEFSAKTAAVPIEEQKGIKEQFSVKLTDQDGD